ncbi:probable inactive serine/threonine-protein kinase bub1 [Juglans regia]|uniref:Probable inactive serine/threonine-protein kinase bub1 n=2 Tax=Juglans regia TaxID=51240 RepID=A0A2I4DYR7_JUGRE|nr:probable inactive serine/threonine-protein kinase bub1 [Juglans regia]
MANNTTPDLFSSLISDIKTYSGKDPLLPWIRGIRKMKDSLPSQLLKEKLPRFLQKCAQTFESDRRYRNDLRYLRVWLQLMDFVDDPRALLRTMEANHIGTKRSLFYQAYALYFEKIKKFEEAEKMYHLGVQNFAEPVDELQKSYEQFLHRMERYKNKRTLRQEGKAAKGLVSASSIYPNGSKTEENNENICRVEDMFTRSRHDRALPVTLPDDHQPHKTILEESPLRLKPLMEPNYTRVSENSCNVRTDQDLSAKKEFVGTIAPGGISKHQVITERESEELKFVDTVIVGKSEAEDACHHGLVDPTINMKEAMRAINSMFREPIEAVPVGWRSRTSQTKEEGTCQSDQESLKIYVDDEEGSEVGEKNEEKDNIEQREVLNKTEGSISSASCGNAFVFPSPNDFASEGSDDQNVESSTQSKFREDTVVCRFVGSTILDEPEVENVCHHGLVDPTINLKEAMEDINNMFGKPMDFVRSKRSKRQDKAPEHERDFGGFSILVDDDLEDQEVQLQPNLARTSRERDLFEPTVFTKEAMDDINKMFGMPLNF